MPSPKMRVSGHWVVTNVFGAPCTECDITWGLGVSMFVLDGDDVSGQQLCSDCYRTHLEERRG